MTRTTGPDCAVMCNLVNTYSKENINIRWSKGSTWCITCLGAAQISVRLVHVQYSFDSPIM